MTRPVLAWVEAHHDVRLNDDTRAVVRALLDGPPTAEVRECLGAAGIGYNVAYWRLAKKRLPRPIAWRRLARGVQVAECLRAHPGVSLADLAHSVGYADHTGASHAVRRAFGVPLARARRMRPSALLARWYEREVGVHV